eukprot:CAMPEP_0175451332 /NCGR_PEP_ID=MMETSP0095-20121207/62837_1 /TAXON_ID=311494 /ORGANISM="Alexandrium monilatum, Strain CCMP3105" /LENGTH=41 /DNA_ID= /DNA_START= /DNA_END= /DNA_ORIENTATION=
MAAAAFAKPMKDSMLPEEIAKLTMTVSDVRRDVRPPLVCAS